MIFIGITSCKKVKTEKEISNDSIIIYLDPGHGGFDGGTTYEGIIEKDITLKVSLLIANYLEKTGFTVKLTRNTDKALGKNKQKDIYKRVDLINSSKAVIYISIHVNSYPSNKVWGFQTFYSDKSEENKILAEDIMKMLYLMDNSNKRIAKMIYGKYLLEHTVITGCLIELGFLTSESDRHKLIDDEYQRKIAQYIYLGILGYIETKGVQ